LEEITTVQLEKWWNMQYEKEKFSVCSIIKSRYMNQTMKEVILFLAREAVEQSGIAYVV
jgi:hypothetical protein